MYFDYNFIILEKFLLFHINNFDIDWAFIVDSLFSDVLVQIFAIASFLLVGTAFVKIFSSKLSGIKLIAYASATGVVFFSILGLILPQITSVLPSTLGPIDRKIAILSLILVDIGAFLFLFLRRESLFKHENPLVECRLPLFVWVALSILCICIGHIKIDFPRHLQDGPYVIKNHNMHVKIQVINGHLPADNLLPYLASEYLVRGISFKNERPILPGQEVSNRPILMSLSVLPFRMAFASVPKQDGPLGTFEYVGQQWPNVAKISDDSYYQKFLSVAIVLNALIVLGVSLLLRTVGLRKYEWMAMILLFSSPYIISQVLFIWPKAMAAFFIIISAILIRERKSYWFSGASVGLAYLSHPYALVFAGAFGLYNLIDAYKNKIFKNLARYTIAITLVMLPWFLWSKVYLGFSSDLVAQNFLKGMESFDFIWVRLVNLYNVIGPRAFSVYPFDAEKILNISILNLPSIIGCLLFIQSYAGVYKFFKEEKFIVLYAILIPGLLLIFVFSYSAAPALHGFQAISAFMLIFLFKWYEKRKYLLISGLIVAQVIINIISIYPRAANLSPSYDIFDIKQEKNITGADLMQWRDLSVIDGGEVAPQLNIRMSISGINKEAIWMNAGNSVVFHNIALGETSLFKSEVAVVPEYINSMDMPDLDFNVMVRKHSGEIFEVGKLTINPKVNRSERGWIPYQLDLKKFKGEKVDLVLNVDSQQKGIWSLWAEPKITP